MRFLDDMMIRLRAWCAMRAAYDETAGLDDRTKANIRASGRQAFPRHEA